MPAEKFQLVIPLDASGVKEFTPDQEVKVVIQLKDRSIIEQVGKFDAEKKAEIVFGFKEIPSAVCAILGPAEATANELLKMDTLRINVPPRLWIRQTRVVLPPVRIAPYYWNWWRIWCKTFTIRGRVICPDGRPIPGATVNAFDVDWWFWWTSRQQVGSTVTDGSGAFEITFRWCCIFLPPWWWLHRVWEIDPWLIKRIQPILRRDPNFILGRVGNQPSMGVFAHLLEGEGDILKRPLEVKDAERLEKIRTRLLGKIPPAPELEKLQIWPWYPWWPWRDCVPDIIFKVTQDTLTPGTVILDEGTWNTRWNIPNPLDVTLVANDKAWCKPENIEKPEQCMVFTQVCGNPIDQIGGNLGAVVQPAGYLNPGGSAVGSADYSGDRPFAGSVVVEKIPKDMLNVDYYEIEYVNEVDLDACRASWQPLPAKWALDFYRHWMQILPGAPGNPLIVTTGNVLFNWQLIDGHWVLESREHSEATGGLTDWDLNRWWLHNRDTVMVLDSAKFPDGAYRFRIVGWEKNAANALVNGKVLPVCGTQDEASLVLAFDNRLEPDPFHPTNPSHVCGVGTQHRCVTEPDTDFISVKVGGQEIGPCQIIKYDPTAMLEINFTVTDPLKTRTTSDPSSPETTGSHLAYYELYANYGENLSVNLLQSAASVDSIPSGVPTGWNSGDLYGTYGRALGAGSIGPHWEGGTYRLTIPVGKAFPEPCCYQLTLVAHNRQVVGCDHNYDYYNVSTYTIGVGI
jgi:hypothetical protein